MTLNRRLITLGVLALLLLVAGIAYTNWRSAHPPITVTSDSIPVRLQLNDRSVMITKKHATLRLPKSVYNYRATYGSGTAAINLHGTVDTLDSPSSQSISLAYNVFSKAGIYAALCSIEGNSLDACGYKEVKDTLQTKFVADHSWAIVNFILEEDELKGPAILALKLDSNHKWQKAAGPFPGVADFTGLVPVEILEAIRQ